MPSIPLALLIFSNSLRYCILAPL